jgi:hypothetical protein
MNLPDNVIGYRAKVQAIIAAIPKAMVLIKSTRTANDSQSATLSSFMVASLNEPVSIEPAIRPFASSHKRIDDRLLCAPKAFSMIWQFRQHRRDETEMAMLQLDVFIHG